ncbi:MAG: PIN domain-containing protein [Chloroflexi bacterium]|nr:PIN domain-containing protein [Chloroflexota bacterium]
MNDSFLIDTNVLVYAYDRSQPDKQRRALELLDRLVLGGGVLSTQVLGEFFVTVTRKIPAPLSAREGYERIQNYVRAWTVLSVTPLIVLEAARGVQQHHLSYWGAQIWATARLNQIPVILSEDLPHGTTLDGVSFVNPFVQGFTV